MKMTRHVILDKSLLAYNDVLKIPY